MARRNPYVVLGVPFGTRASAALRFFTRRRRQIRRAGSASLYDLKDLNAALKHLEDRPTDSGAEPDCFRVPANPHVFHPRSSRGVLNPAPQPLDPHPIDVDPGDMAELRQAALRELVVDMLTSYGHLIPFPSTINRRPHDRDTNPTR